jgi:SAM-dependent methyltransferase
MTMHDQYDHIARYYDLSHDRLTDDIPFLLKLAAETGGPVLEPGCGSGRLLIPLARAGYVATGVDNSPEMLARAETRLAGEPAGVRSRVRLLAADMKKLSLPDGEPYGLIVFGYNTFMHLDETGAGAVLKRLRPLLRSDGLLAIDVANPMALAAAADDPDFELEDTLRDELLGETIRQYTAYEGAPGEQMVDVTWVYEQIGAESAPTKARLRLHYLYPHQYDLLLTLTGFRLTAIYGDYDRTPFTEESERLLLVATTSD